MKIGIISDTHIPDRAQEIPKRIIEDFTGCDLILHAGDLVCLEVLDILKNTGKEVRAVWGNMDPYEVRKELAEQEIIQAGGFNIGLVHGNGTHAKLIDYVTAAFKKDAPQIIVFGHSHFPINEKRKGILYFNPGSPTDKVFSPYNSYGILEISNNKIDTQIIKI